MKIQTYHRQAIPHEDHRFFVTNRNLMESGDIVVKEPHFIVSMKDPAGRDVRFETGSKPWGSVRLAFHDAVVQDDTGKLILPNIEDFRGCAALVHRAVIECRFLIFQCEGGVCRSAGFAAAVADHFFGDGQPYFNYYRPNSLVYTLVKQALVECEEENVKHWIAADSLRSTPYMSYVDLFRVARTRLENPNVMTSVTKVSIGSNDVEFMIMKILTSRYKDTKSAACALDAAKSLLRFFTFLPDEIIDAYILGFSLTCLGGKNDLPAKTQEWLKMYYPAIRDSVVGEIKNNCQADLDPSTNW